MSIASTVPCIKLSSSSCASTASSNSSSSTTSSTFRLFTHTKPFTIRCSNADGPLRRPSSPSLKEPTPPMKPIAPNSPPSLSPSPSPPVSKPTVASGVSQVSSSQNVVTMEFQRKMAIELQEYFRKKKLEEASQGPFFGWVAKNEIGNGRWAMFGFAVGLLTEYATGTDFVDQMKILLSNFGIVDLD
ncbi:light-harvesting complex-like protein OHP2, chloroplastic [Papaver somniferum]|uniref:light-harvesting complex-like protein OHP2, chloroplastic n=1 Tax=Papaver somniferum TaxID=3469 RepID=UPI000E6F9E06|nr:light-harvesting complex-like protein OHP2, chloroplastic [Papaver somniferum]